MDGKGGGAVANSPQMEQKSDNFVESDDKNKDEESKETKKDDIENENTSVENKNQPSGENENKVKVGNTEVKLCGWLLIFSRGLISTNRSRWFVFGDNTCKLYYYRNPQDLLPLGEIDIAHASFYFDASNTDKPGSFEIRCGGKEYMLDAHDRHTMMYWLQELQKRRKIYSIKRNSLSKERVGQRSVKRPNQLSGLATAVDGGKDEDIDHIMGNSIPRIQVPLRSSSDVPSQGRSQAWSLTNLKAEIQNVVTNIKKSPGNDQKKSLLPSNSSSPRLTPSPNSEDFTIIEHGENLRTVDYSSGNHHTSQHHNQQGKIISAFKNLKPKTRRSPQRSSADSSGHSDGIVLSHPCIKCKQLQNELTNINEEHQLTESELQANRDIVRLLQKEVDTLRKEMQTKDDASYQNEAGLLEMLSERDKHIVELQYGLFTMKEDIEINNQKLRVQKGELKDSADQVTMFRDMLKAKDEVIVSLTDQVFDLESKLKNSKQTHGQTDATVPEPETVNQPVNSTFYTEEQPPTSVMVTQNIREVEKLRDMCSAYEMQNQFLTKEILELNELRQDDEIREKNLMTNYTKVEANYYQSQSKYLFLLKELKSPIRGGEDRNSQQAINQLLEEALDSEVEGAKDMDFHVSSLGQEYDRYGFVKNPGDEEEEESDPLVAKATQLERQSAELSAKIKDKDEIASHHVKWENFMVGQSGKPLHRSAELKAMIRSGIPHEFREEIWKGCIDLCVRNERKRLGDGYYKEMVNKSTNPTSNPASKQIELDLPRTLPNNKHYEDIESDGILKLRNVLLAFSWHNPIIGYCQGLNRLAAIALLFLSEEEAFWCLVAIVDHIMPRDYYSQTLAAAQTDQRVLKDLILEKIPKLHYHFEQHGVDISLFSFNWFLTLFVDNNIPPETFLRIWDTFLYEGSKVLFRFAVAFFKHVEDEIVKQKSTLKLNHLLRTMGEQMSNVRRISQLAFNWINPFPMRMISTKRTLYMQQVRGELAELDKLRADIQIQRRDNVRSDEFSDDES